MRTRPWSAARTTKRRAHGPPSSAAAPTWPPASTLSAPGWNPPPRATTAWRSGARPRRTTRTARWCSATAIRGISTPRSTTVRHPRRTPRQPFPIPTFAFSRAISCTSFGCCPQGSAVWCVGFFSRFSGGYKLFTNSDGNVGAHLASGSGSWCDKTPLDLMTAVVPLSLLRIREERRETVCACAGRRCLT